MRCLLLANKMGLSRLISQELYSYMVTVLSDGGFTNVTVYEAYPDDKSTDFLNNLPAVSIILQTEDDEDFEMGNVKTATARRFIIDVFTESNLDGQASDIADAIKINLKNKHIALYDYNFATPIKLGNISFENLDKLNTTASPRIYNQITIRVDIKTYLLE